MLAVRRGPPLDYSLCNQTVTIYHPLASGNDFACTRTIFHGAALDWRKNQTVDKTGSRETNGFLLVLPSGWGRPAWATPEEYAALPPGAREGRFTLSPLDKVLMGEGPEIAGRDAWAALLPARVSGLVVVKEVDPKYWRGVVCHVEAGG